MLKEWLSETRLNKKKTMIGLGILVVIILLLSLRGGGVPVEIFGVEEKPFTGYIEETGIVEARGAREVQSAVAGRVAEVRVSAGQQVVTGDVLAVLEKGDLQSEVERSQALVKAAKSQLEGAVKGGGVHEVEQARAEVTQAKANLAEAQRQAAQAEALFKSGAISNDEYQQKLTAVKLQKSNLAMAQARLDMLRSGAGQSQRQALEAEVAQAEAQLKLAESQLSKANITAPLDGIVLRKSVEPGAYVQPGIVLFKVGLPTELEVQADILETEVVRVTVGQKVQVLGDVLGNKVVSGRVTEVSPEAVVKLSSLGVEQRRVPVKVALDRNSALRPGFNVDVRIITGEKSKTLSVPEEAVFSEQGKDFVFVVKSGKLTKRQVTTGLTNKEFVEVTAGLKAGEEVVKEPDSKLDEGTKVQKTEEVD